MRSTVRVTNPVEGIEGTTLFEAVDEETGQPVPGPRVAVVGLIHGNEPVGGHALHRLEELAEGQLAAGAILSVRANVEAASQNARHTPEGTDLNRLWDRATLARLRALPEASLCYEERRVLQLAPLLLTCDAIVDLHSTSRPSKPFLVLRDDQRHTTLARRLGVQHLVTGLHENAILSGGLCCNVGLDVGERSPRVGLTYEAGQHTDPGNGERAWMVVHRALYQLGLWRTEPPPPKVQGEVYEVFDRFLQAPGSSEAWRFVGYEGGEPGGGRRGPLRRLHSFEEVQAGEVIARRGANVVARAQTPFTMLMPAPYTDPGTDLFYVTQPRHGGLSAGGERTDAEARREALAIERMLDLVDDDGFVRGTTWVSMDARQVLDRCADVIGRTLRLPVGHPHRRITVVGRGDVGEEEAERRAGQRYRQAMRRAIAEGVPITRVQLLRGALLAWLDSLTSHGMVELTRQRAERWPEAGGVHLQVSLQQPHTVSLLVAGDLELALQTGDARHVRVGMLVEAATVEPDGPTARVRVVRLGVLSSRAEILNAAQKLLGTLHAEHQYHVRHGALAGDPRVERLLRESGEIESNQDPAMMAELRAALYRVQLRLWCDVLQHEPLEDVPVLDGPMLGQWLTTTMASTGILDASALKDLLLREVPGGWRVDADAVRRLGDTLQATHPGLDALPSLSVAGVRPLPSQPLMATDVDADDLERWFSWKRWVRNGQLLPGDRGKDLDVVFDDREVRERLVRWYQHARSRAAASPGDVMMVVAGDGSNPKRDDWELLRAHRAALVDPNLGYLRIQHAAGTHLSWLKDFVGCLASRPAGPGQVAVQWESEHGATVSVVMLAVRSAEERAQTRPWSLDGWAVERCLVILSDMEHTGGRDYKVALITEPLGRGQAANAELLHFGRQHCEGLLKQGRWRLLGEGGPPSREAVDACIVEQLRGWIERARTWRSTSTTIPPEPERRAYWIARRLGIADELLTRTLVTEMDRGGDPGDAARSIWERVPAWPGRHWHHVHELD